MKNGTYIAGLGAVCVALMSVGCCTVASNLSRERPTGAGQRGFQRPSESIDDKHTGSRSSSAPNEADRREAFEKLKKAIEGVSRTISEGDCWANAAKHVERLLGANLSLVDLGQLRSLLSEVKQKNALVIVLLALGRIEKKWSGPVLAEYLKSSETIVRAGAAYALTILPKSPSENEQDATSGWFDRQHFAAAWESGQQIPFELAMQDVGPVQESELRAALIAVYGTELEITVQLFSLHLLRGSANYDDVAKSLSEQLLGDSFLLARQAAAHSLSGTTSKEGREALRQAIKNDSDAGVRILAIGSLGTRGSEDDFAYIEGRYPVTTDVGEKGQIVETLGNSKFERFQGSVADLIATESETTVITDALRALAKRKSKYALDALVRNASSSDLFVRVVVAKYLGVLGDPNARSVLETLANDKVDFVREVAQSSLKRLPR